MDGTLKRITLVCALGGICISGGGTLIFPFLPIYLLELGASEEDVALWTSIASSCTFLVGAIVLPWWGALADRIGKKTMILRSAGCLALAFFIGSLVQTPFQFILMRMFQGFSFGFFPICQALLSSIGGAHTAEAIGFLMAGRSAGTVLGPFLGGFLSHFVGMRMSFAVAAAGDLLCFLLILFFIKEPPQTKSTRKPGMRESFRVLSHNRPYMRLFALMIVNQAAILIINPIIAIYIAKLTGTWDNADVLAGLIFGACGGAGILSAPVWGKICEKKGVYPAIILSFSGAGFFALAQFAAPTVLAFGIFQFCFGLFIVGGMTSITSAVAECTDPSTRGSAYGLTAAAMNIGNCIGPLIGGMAASFIAVDAVFFLGGLVQIGAAFLVWRSRKHHSAA